MITTSVIVVSRHRPDDLRLCLLSLHQQFRPNFEVIVVADPTGIAAVQALGFSQKVKLLSFDEPNISAARNLGLSVAAGEIIAFIDDDAVAEPTWLQRLIAPFDNPDVSASTGFVRGRNGISFQWKATTVDVFGRDTALDVPDHGQVFAGAKGHAIKTVGTNCAFRAALLREIGGFDPGYRFYLDETDTNMRLAELGLQTAVVPTAQVVHGFAQSAMRDKDRTPRDLTEIGASSARFLRKFAGKEGVVTGLTDLRLAQEKRLKKFQANGRLTDGAVKDLLATLEVGISRGKEADITALSPLSANTTEVLPFDTMGEGEGLIFKGRPRTLDRMKQDAALCIAQGQRASIFAFDSSARFHRVWFEEPGIWVQSGGLFGKSDRDDPLLAVWRRSRRFEREISRSQAMKK